MSQSTLPTPAATTNSADTFETRPQFVAQGPVIRHRKATTRRQSVRDKSESDAFAAVAPDAVREPKLRGRRKPLTLTLPPDLIAAVDAVAATERRSRASMIEMFCVEGVERRTAARQAA